MNIIKREESQYFKKYNLCFWTKARYGRKADTIILYVLKTPTGRWSKYHATLRFNSERNVKNMMEKIKKYYDELINKTFKNEIKKNYCIGEVILYSGELQ